MRETVADLLQFDDADIMRLLGVNRVTLYKWRKGTEQPSAEQIAFLLDFAEVLNTAPAEPDPNDPAFGPYIAEFLQLAEQQGLEDAYLAWNVGQACGCLGPQGGSPFCPCEMRRLTARKVGKVVRREESDA